MATATVGILRVILSGNSAEFESAMKRASGAAAAMSKDLGQIGRQATQIGSALTKTITLPILALGVGSVKAAMDFESSFANVAKTVDGVSDASGKLTVRGEALAMTFRNMAKEIPKTTEELTAIAALGGQMGVPIENLEKFTRNVAALGVAVDGISAEEAAAGLAQIANVFGDKQVKDIDKMSSALVHLGNSSNATEGDILEFTKRLSGAGAAANMTVPEVMAIGTAMANVGINAEAGGTAMSTMITKMSMAVSDGGKSLEAFANITKMTTEEFSTLWKKSSVEAVDAVVKGLSAAKASGQDLNLVVREIGATNIRTADTMKRLAGAGTGVSDSLKISNEGWKTGNKHLEEAEKKYATTANQLKILWSHIRDVGITLGNALLPAIKSMIGMLTSLMPIVDGIARAFAAMPGPLQGLIVGLGLAVAAAGPLLFVFGQLITSASVVVGAFTKKGIAARLLATSLGTTSASATTAAASVTTMGTASTGAAVGVGTLTAALGTALFWSGIGIAIGGIAFGVYKVVGAIKDASKALSEGRFWEFFLAKDKDNWLRGALGMDTGKAPPPKPISVMSRAEDDAEFEAAVARSNKIDATTAATVRLTAARDNLKTATQEIANADKAYHAEIKGLEPVLTLQIQNMDKTGNTTKELAAQYGISEQAVKRFQSELKGSEKAHKGAEKAATAHEKAIQKQTEALEKLGVVTGAGVNKNLGELADLVKLATDAGVPLDRVLASMVPRFKELHEKAKASGAGVREAAAALDMAEAAAKRLAEPLRLLSSEHIPLIGRTFKDTTDFLVRQGDVGAKALEDSFKFFGLKTRAELAQTEREAIANFKLIEASGKATPEQIQKAFDAMNAAIRENGGNTATDLEDAYKRMGLKTKAELDAAADQAVADFKTISDCGFATAADIETAAKRMREALVAAGRDVPFDWKDFGKGLIPAFNDAMKIIASGGSWKNAAVSFATGVADQLKKSGSQIGEAIGKGITGVLAIAEAISGGMSQGDSTKRGAAAGAQAGMAFGPYGALIGAGIGALAGFVKGMQAGRREIKTFAESFGGFDELHKKLSAMGAEGERIWINLTQTVANNDFKGAGAAIDEARKALDAFGTDAERAEKRLTAIGSAIEGVNAKAAIFAKGFEKPSEDIQKQVADIKEAMRRIDDERNPLLGINRPEGRTALTEGEQALADRLDAQWDALNAKLKTVKGSISELSAHSQAEFERIGIFAAAAFAGMVKETGDAIGAIQQLGPTISILKQGIDEFGLSGTGAINALLENFDLVNSEITGPILSSIQATGQIFTGLRDGGLMTAELFQTVSDDIGASFRDLEVKGGDVSKAMALSQPVLQALWEGQEKYGTVTDETTLKLLDQAEEQGLVGAGMKDVNLQILDVLMAIADVFGAKIPDSLKKTQAATKTAAEIIESNMKAAGKTIEDNFKAAGKSIEDTLKSAGKTIEDNFSRIRISPIRVPIEYDDPGYTPAQPSAGAATGGLVTSGGIQYRDLGGPIRWTPRGTDRVPVMLTPGELILNEGQQGRIGDALHAAMRAADMAFHAPARMFDASMSRDVGSLHTTTIMEVDKRELGRAVADVLPGELRRLGVRVRV